jgi:hypothetical protein
VNRCLCDDCELGRLVEVRYRRHSLFGTAYYTDDPGIDIELPADWYELDSTGWSATRVVDRPLVEPWHRDGGVP